LASAGTSVPCGLSVGHWVDVPSDTSTCLVFPLTSVTSKDHDMGRLACSAASVRVAVIGRGPVWPGVNWRYCAPPGVPTLTGALSWRVTLTDWMPLVSNRPSSSVRGLLGVGSVGLLGSTSTTPQRGGSVSLGVSGEGVTPHTAWPLTISPTAVGPNRYMCRALTVSEPSGFTICWL
jgi:hypothetical protein